MGTEMCAGLHIYVYICVWAYTHTAVLINLCVPVHVGAHTGLRFFLCDVLFLCLSKSSSAHACISSTSSLGHVGLCVLDCDVHEERLGNILREL